MNNASQMDEYCADKGFSGWYESSAKDDINIAEAAKYLVSKVEYKTNQVKHITYLYNTDTRCATRITTWCTKIAPPFALIARFLQLQAQNNADKSLKKPTRSNISHISTILTASQNPGLAFMKLILLILAWPNNFFFWCLNNICVSFFIFCRF